MKKLKKILSGIIISILGVYVLICILAYFFQESLIFHPAKLAKDKTFDFQRCTEKYFYVPNGDTLHGLTFAADTTIGLVFYLHGNAGALDTWGKAHEAYTALGYDFFILDYPGFGKSSGTITSEEQIHKGIEYVYSMMANVYMERNIVVIGYSIGTGPAAYLASIHKPRQLILQAPYYSLLDLSKQTYPFLPEFLSKYPLRTNEFLKTVECPIAIFHGDADEIIPYESSVRLKEFFKEGDTLYTLPGAKHNGMNDLPGYREILRKII